jgi:hypothetical protein
MLGTGSFLMSKMHVRSLNLSKINVLVTEFWKQFLRVAELAPTALIRSLVRFGIVLRWLGGMGPSIWPFEGPYVNGRRVTGGSQKIDSIAELKGNSPVILDWGATIRRWAGHVPVRVAAAAVAAAAASSSTLAPARLVAQARLCERLRVTSGWWSGRTAGRRWGVLAGSSSSAWLTTYIFLRYCVILFPYVVAHMFLALFLFVLAERIPIWHWQQKSDLRYICAFVATWLTLGEVWASNIERTRAHLIYFSSNFFMNTWADLSCLYLHFEC